MFPDIAWNDVLLPSLSPLEIIVRGSLIYLGTFILLRIVAKRELGSLAVSDLIVVVFIADAGQNGMSGQYRSVVDGLLLIGVLVGWAYVLDRLAFHVPWFERLTKPPPLLLVKDGQILHRNMRREAVTTAELMGAVREQGADDLSSVERAYVEGNGTISVIQRDPQL